MFAALAACSPRWLRVGRVAVGRFTCSFEFFVGRVGRASHLGLRIADAIMLGSSRCVGRTEIRRNVVGSSACARAATTGEDRIRTYIRRSSVLRIQIR
jgi:hypothetical protein